MPRLAEKAIPLLNNTELYGSELRVMWYRPGGLHDKVTANLFIKGLGVAARSKDLISYFSKYGTILSGKVVYDDRGDCKGYGYLQFEIKESAEKAIADANGKVWNEKKLEVLHFNPKRERTGDSGRYNNLYVKCFPKTFTEGDLKKLFEKHGHIDSVFVKPNLGFGFVCFKTPEEAKQAEDSLNGYSLDGQKLYVGRALRKEERKRQLKEERMLLYKDCNLYVRDFPEDTNDEKLKAAFSVFGTVVSARVMLEKKQDLGTDRVEYQSKGYGFVCFKSTAEAAKAKAASVSADILGRRLYVNIAESREERGLKSMNRLQFAPYVHFGPQRGYYPGPRRGRGMRRSRMRGPPMAEPYMMPQLYPMMPPEAYPPPYPPMMMPPQAAPYPRVDYRPVAPQLPTDYDTLGEMLYPLVEKKSPQYASKITGMLLEKDVHQIHAFLTDETELDRWIDEALKILSSPAPAQK